MEMANILLALTEPRPRPAAGCRHPDNSSEPGDSVPFDLDIGSALDLLAHAVHSRGADYTGQPAAPNGDEYLTTLYAHDGTPPCIVGDVLLHAGVSVEAIEAMGQEGIRELYLAGRLPIRITLGALVVLRRAQLAQDQGSSWGEAFRHAAEAAFALVGILPGQLPPAVVDRITRGQAN